MLIKVLKYAVLKGVSDGGAQCVSWFSSTSVGDSDAHVLTVPCSGAMTQSRLGLCHSAPFPSPPPPRVRHVSLTKMAFQVPGCSKRCLFLDLLTTVIPGPKHELWAQGEGDLGFFFFFF